MENKKIVPINSQKENTPPPKKPKSKFRQNVEKLGFAFLLPVSLLPIAGIFLGIGSVLTNAISSGLGNQIGELLTAIGNVGFKWMPLFFALATTLAFSKHNGYAAFAVVFGYLIFAFIQSPLVFPNSDNTLANISIGSFTIYHNLPIQLFDNSIGGVYFVNSSVFGGILIGLIVAFLYRRFQSQKLPNLFSFFSEERFVPIITLPAMILLAIVFILVWPLIGMGLIKFGEASTHFPFGLDSLSEFLIERILMPFGLNMLIYASALWTDVGGTLNPSSFHGVFMPGTHTLVLDWLQQHHPDLYEQLKHGISGDQRIWFFFRSAGLPFNLPVHNANPGRYISGRFVFMMMGLTFAGLAIIMAAKPEHRKITIGVIGSGILTNFITGTTQPLEYSFLFACPFLFFGPHTILCALSGLVMNVVGAHLGLAYSGGLIDYLFYPVTADFMNLHANSWLAIVVGIPFGLAYFFSFYFYIKIKKPSSLIGQTAIVL